MAMQYFNNQNSKYQFLNFWQNRRGRENKRKLKLFWTFKYKVSKLPSSHLLLNSKNLKTRIIFLLFLQYKRNENEVQIKSNQHSNRAHVIFFSPLLSFKFPETKDPKKSIKNPIKIKLNQSPDHINPNKIHKNQHFFLNKKKQTLKPRTSTSTKLKLYCLSETMQRNLPDQEFGRKIAACGQFRWKKMYQKQREKKQEEVEAERFDWV